MRISTAFPSKYLQASDIPPGRTATVTIGDIRMEHVGGEDDNEAKPVLYFQGKQKGLVMNKTNANTIADAYGDETESWYGRQIELFAAETEFRGRRVPCLRVRVAQSQQPPAPQPTQPPAASAPASMPPQPAPNPNSGAANNWPAQEQQAPASESFVDPWAADDARHGDDIPF